MLAFPILMARLRGLHRSPIHLPILSYDDEEPTSLVCISISLSEAPFPLLSASDFIHTLSLSCGVCTRLTCACKLYINVWISLLPRSSRLAQQRIVRWRLARSWPCPLEGLGVSVSTVFYRLRSDGEVLPVVGSEPFEKWTQGWHAGGDAGEIVFDAAIESISDEGAR